MRPILKLLGVEQTDGGIAMIHLATVNEVVLPPFPFESEDAETVGA